MVVLGINVIPPHELPVLTCQPLSAPPRTGFAELLSVLERAKLYLASWSFSYDSLCLDLLPPHPCPHFPFRLVECLVNRVLIFLSLGSPMWALS